MKVIFSHARMKKYSNFRYGRTNCVFGYRNTYLGTHAAGIFRRGVNLAIPTVLLEHKKLKDDVTFATSNNDAIRTDLCQKLNYRLLK